MGANTTRHGSFSNAGRPSEHQRDEWTHGIKIAGTLVKQRPKSAALTPPQETQTLAL